VAHSDCVCPENHATYSSFSGFTTAIETNTIGNQYPVTLDQVHFSNNLTGIRINGNPFATVTRCDFDLQQEPTLSTYNTGLYLNSCTGYKVEENHFHKASKLLNLTSKGILVNNSGTAVNKIYKNFFDTLDYGVFVQQTNTGLQLSCNVFCYDNYDIYSYNGSIASTQGSLQQGADNQFVNTLNNSIYCSLGRHLYYYSNTGYHTPYNPCNCTVDGRADFCDCASTLCDNGGGVTKSLSEFQSDVDAYTSAAAGSDGSQDNNNLPALTEAYYSAVRTLISDSLLDLSALEQWHAAAQPIADPYSLTETRFMEGFAETFAENAGTDAETANYAEFHAMKLALRGQNDNMDNQDNNSPFVNWYALTPAQIAQLQTIAERNTGRTSVMAKGVLCFFFGICYEDEWDDALAENRSAKGEQKSAAPQWTYWHIAQLEPAYYPMTFSLTSDTLILNTTYFLSDFTLQNKDGNTERLLLHEDSTGMYYYDPALQTIRLLYPYLENAGYQYDIYPILGDTTHLLRVTIDSVSMDNIDGQDLKVFFISTVTTNLNEPVYDWSFDIRNADHHAKVIEHIGSTGFFVPQENAWNDIFFRSLCSYEDNAIYYKAVDSISCDEPYVYNVPLRESSPVNVYPNPVSNNLTVSSESPIQLVTVYDHTGRVVYSRQSSDNTLIINMTSWSPNSYLLRVET
jgi:hypothetical protein